VEQELALLQVKLGLAEVVALGTKPNKKTRWKKKRSRRMHESPIAHQSSLKLFKHYK